MNLDMIRLKFETEDLLLSLNKNCEMLNKQTHRKLEKKHWTFHFPNQDKHFISTHFYPIKDLGCED